MPDGRPWPRVSIVTPSYNQGQFIEETIRSVLLQGYPDLEYIIIDGGSTDGSVEIIKKYEKYLAYWASEPDQGVYDALNKGIRLAQGEIIGHLNSDDFYEENIFAEVAERFAADPQLDAVYGGAIVFEENANGARRTVAEYLVPPDVELSFRNITVGVPIINARFFRKRVYAQIGLYDTRYRIAADRDFLLRAALAGVKSTHLGCLVYHYRQHPGSLTLNRLNVQRMKILSEHLGMAERYLQTDGVSSEARRYCRLWHARAATEGVVLALRKMRYLEAVRYGMRGWRYDLWWPIAFASFVIPKISRLPFRRYDGRG